MPLKTFSGVPAVQVESELMALLGVVAVERPSSYIEVGVGRGDTFHAIVSAMRPGSFAVAVDNPEQGWGLDGSRAQLEAAAADLRAYGYKIELIFGDSKDPEIIAKANAHGPFDLAFIDGDHTLDGITSDFQNYPAKTVAFHDIADTMRPNDRGEKIEVPVFWAEIKEHCQHSEFIAPKSTMGIGVIYKC